MDLKAGIVLVSPNLNWTNVPLREALESELERPVVLENDVRGAAWGEHKLGAGRGREDMLAVWIGTGVGGGLILNGSIYHGEFGSAGEFGHMSVTPFGDDDMRTVEHRCSRTGMARIIRRRLDDHPESPVWAITDGTGQITGSKQFARALEAGCPLTRAVIDEAADILGVAIASAITLLAVDTVVLGGGVTEALGEPYLQRVRKSFERYVFPDRSRRCELLMTELKDDAGLLGAAMLARDARASDPAPRAASSRR
jgi:glucokinase